MNERVAMSKSATSKSDACPCDLFSVRSVFQSSVLKNPLPMETPITLWIEELRAADEDAATKLWNHFVRRLCESARRLLRPDTRPAYDEEDAALSAFNSLCGGIVNGRFPDLQDRDGLWKLLLVITERKVAHRVRHDQQQRRDVRRNLTQSIFSMSAEESARTVIEVLPSREPTPEFAAEFAETCKLLFHSLGDAALQEVVTLRMEGCADSEIAAKLNCSRRTVQRRLEVIRRHWDLLEFSSE